MNQCNIPFDIAILGMGTPLPAHAVAQSDIVELIAPSLLDYAASLSSVMEEQDHVLL
ncbi:hypothetical protein [Paenibacillus sp.]